MLKFPNNNQPDNNEYLTDPDCGVKISFLVKRNGEMADLRPSFTMGPEKQKKKNRCLRLMSKDKTANTKRLPVAESKTI